MDRAGDGVGSSAFFTHAKPAFPGPEGLCFSGMHVLEKYIGCSLWSERVVF